MVVTRTDALVVAEHEGVLGGAVRICDAHDVLVLRGMRVREGMRRQGIGARLLQAVEPVIGAEAVTSVGCLLNLAVRQDPNDKVAQG